MNAFDGVLPTVPVKSRRKKRWSMVRTALKFAPTTVEKQKRQKLLDLKKALRVAAFERTKEHLDLIYEWIMASSGENARNLFGQAPEYLCREICRHMKIITRSAGEIIVRQGDFGDCCYIIIDGLSDVHVQHGKVERRQSYRGSRLSTVIGSFGVKVATIASGTMFGDLAFSDPSARRSATVIVSTEIKRTSLITIERGDYVRLSRTVSQEESHFQHTTALNYIHLFRNWNKEDKLRLVSGMRMLHVEPQKYIWKNESDEKLMVIILSGQVSEMYTATIDKEIKHGKLVHRVQHSYQTELAVYGPGDLVGEYPFFYKNRTPYFGLRANTLVKALVFDKRVFDTEFDAETKQELLKLSRERNDWRQQRIEGKKIDISISIRMTWKLMKIAEFPCARCGLRSHTARDTVRCRVKIPKRQAKVDPGRNLVFRRPTTRLEEEEEMNLDAEISCKELLHQRWNDRKQLKLPSIIDDLPSS